MDDYAVLARARQLLSADHAVDAERIAREVVARAPDSGAAFEVLSRALTAQDRGREGAEAARAGLVAEPADPGLGIALCNALIADDRSHEARTAAEALVRTHPHDVNSHYTLALAHLGAPAPQPARALRAAREAHRLAPHDPDVLNLCGVCHNAVGEREWARNAFQAALRQDPTNSFALANLAGQDIDSLRLTKGGSRLTAAMLARPHSALLQRQFARQLTRIGFRFFGLALVCLFAVFLLTFQPWWVHASVATLLSGVMIGLAVPVIRSLPRGVRGWAPLVWRHASWTARISLGVGVLMVIGMLAFGFGPSSAPPLPASASGESGSRSGSTLADVLRAGVLVAVVLARASWSERQRWFGRNHARPPGSGREVRRGR